MISTNDFRPGVTIEYRNAVWQVQESMHIKPGKGAAFVRTRLKNLQTDEVLAVNFRAGERLTPATIEKLEVVYFYRDGDSYIMMNEEEYVEVEGQHLGSDRELLKEGLAGINILRHKARILRVDLPRTVELQVIDTAPDDRGDTACGGSKRATLETGAIVIVPPHIRIGETIRIDSHKRAYLGRI